MNLPCTKDKLMIIIILIIIIMTNLFLARQALPLRGDWHSDEGSETDSNFIQLLNFCCEDDPSIVEWLEGKKFKYTSPMIQNELLEVRLCVTIHLFFHANDVILNTGVGDRGLGT